MAETDEFYNTLASEYDSMTRFKARLTAEESMLRRWRDRYRFDSALDAACGTGLHAVLLARIGVKTTAADASGAMLDEARRHAAEEGADVRFVEAQFSNLPNLLSDRFRAVLVLGNSLPHVLKQDELVASLRGLERMLESGGIVVLQLLNYDRILAGRERIIGVNHADDKYFVRFYDFLEELVQFNVLVIAQEGEKIRHRLTSTLLRPYRLSELASTLEKTDLRIINTFGDMNFTSFDPGKSPNLVIVAKSKDA